MKNMPDIRQKDLAHGGFEKTAGTAENATMAPPPKKTDSTSETVRTIVYAVLLALVIRTFAFEPFNIPSGSMIPNLLVGDYLFVSKFSYGYSAKSIGYGMVDFDGRPFWTAPKRGDVVVFKLPTNTSIDYIKRLIGLPGDRLQMKEGRLYINDVIVQREKIDDFIDDSDPQNPITYTQYIETLPDGFQHKIIEEGDAGRLDNTAEYTVPAGHYFFMGDNRDNSQDSRVQELVGYVPAENLVGPAQIQFFSIRPNQSIFEFWRWGETIRFERLFARVQ